jgi:AcrR family transcriptional regulator
MTNGIRGMERAIDARGERILEAALQEFIERGFAGARVSVIARVAGVSGRTFREYFPDRAELFREVVRTTLVSLVRGALDRSVFLERLRRPEAVAMARWYREEFEGFPELRVFYETEILARLEVLERSGLSG